MENSQVSQDGSVVRRINGVGAVAGVGTIEGMVPFSRDLSTGGNIDDGLGHGLVVGVNTTVTNDVVRVNIHDGLNGFEVSVKPGKNSSWHVRHHSQAHEYRSGVPERHH